MMTDNINQLEIKPENQTQSNFLDPWNWKTPSRCDLMSLSNINEKQDLTRVKTAVGLRTNRRLTANLSTQDIQGAKPRIYAPAVVNKPQFFNDNSDIYGSKPKALHYGLTNKPETNLSNIDIEGSKPECVKFRTTRPPQNPLNPEYKLPSFEIALPDPPKFIRDQINIDDIDGSKPKQKKELAQRDNYNINDIEGAKPKVITNRKVQHDQIYADVSQKNILKRKEPHNPQDPKYKIRDEKGNLVEIGKVDGSFVPEQYYRKNVNEQNPSLKSRDIKGNVPGSTYHGNFHTFSRRQIKKIGDNTDIIGSTADSLKKGIKIPEGQEKRITNPLDPIYKIPGNSELTSDNINDPFGEAGCSVSKTNLNQKRQSLIQNTQKPKLNIQTNDIQDKQQDLNKQDFKLPSGKYTPRVGQVQNNNLKQDLQKQKSQKEANEKAPSIQSSSKKNIMVASSRPQSGRNLTNAQKLEKFISK